MRHIVGILNVVMVLLLTSGLSASICQAETKDTMMYLMNEPVSMWEWGSYRLENQLSENNLIPKASVRVSYNSGNNRIVISSYPSLLSGHFKSKDKAKIWCDSFAKVVRASLAINPETGRGMVDIPDRAIENVSFLYSYFYHKGFSRKGDFSKPENVEKELDMMAELNIVAVWENNDQTYRLSCKAPLLDTKIYCAEEKVDKPSPK